MAKSPHYKKELALCYERVNFEPVYSFLQNAENVPQLELCESVLSIGAGNGKTDIFVTEKRMPHLKQYIGIEPDDDYFGQLTACFDKNFNFKVTLNKSRVEEFDGPPSRVDCIFLFQVLYHVDSIKDTLKRCYSWLNKGGHIVIMHRAGDDLISKTLCQCGIQPNKSMIDICNVLSEEGFVIKSDQRYQIYTEISIKDPGVYLINLFTEMKEQTVDPKQVQKCIELLKRASMRNEIISCITECLVLSKSTK